MEYKYAFQPIKIGPHTIRNRIEVSPAEPFLCTRDGLVTDAFVAFTAAMARGGAGIVTVGDSPVTQQYADANHYVVNLADPFVVHGLFKVSDAIHRYGAKASIELNLRADWKPADISHTELLGVIEDFATSAERCRKAGFDMVMLHCGHGHNVSQFFSPFMNKRTDEYGCQNMSNRCRFASDLIDAVREKIGADMGLEIRMSGDELFPDGVHIDDAVELAKNVQDRVDLFQISAGSMYDPRTVSYTIQPQYMPMTTNLHLAERFKKELKRPVGTVGSFNMPLAEKALSEGKVDTVAMIRAFIADPDHVNKARLGHDDEIRPCIRCNVCTGDDPHGCPKPLRCTVNPVAGRNPLFDEIRRADVAKKVVIIGGGAAGMEAARRCVQRGHSVVLFESNPALGGSLLDAGANTIKSDVKRYAEWSVRMTLRTSGIDLRLGKAAKRADVVAEKPDAVIIAAGSDQIIPRVNGVDGENVMTAVDVDAKRSIPGHRVVLVGAGLTGSETAVTLAREGHQVTVIDLIEMDKLESANRSVAAVHRMAAEAGAKLLGGLRLISIGKDAIYAEDKNGEKTSIPCDGVVLSLGVRPRANMIAEFSGICDETYIVGDINNRAGNITSAVREGFYAAVNI